MDNTGDAKNNILRDTIIISAASAVMQGLGFLLNIYVANTMGTAAVGVMSLIFSFFGFFMVLANGNIFTSTSRLVSEAIGSNGSIRGVMLNAFTFCICLSGFFCAVVCILSDRLSLRLTGDDGAAQALVILAFSLPLAAAGACIKGCFSASRRISAALAADGIEFMTKFSFLALSLKKSGGRELFLSIAISVFAGELTSFIFLSLKYLLFRRGHTPPCKTGIKGFLQYLRKALPVLVTGYTYMLLSSANEALVPLTLMQYKSSSSEALSEYGIFEAMAMPVLFCPCIILSSLSGILVPEIARERSAGNEKKSSQLIMNALRGAFMYSFIASGVLLTCGRTIGGFICTDALLGRTLTLLAPVIPFVYLETVTESILRGLGKQAFSTVNILFEYTIRISCVLVAVPLIGFDGVILSYYASNVICNIIRIAKALRLACLRFDVNGFIILPLMTVASGRMGAALVCMSAGADADSIYGAVLTLILSVIFCLLFTKKDLTEHNECGKLSSASGMTPITKNS